MKLFDFLEQLAGEDETKKEAIQDMRGIVANSSDGVLISYARYRFPNDPSNLRGMIDALCVEYSISPDPTQMLRLMRFGMFFNEVLWTPI